MNYAAEPHAKEGKTDERTDNIRQIDDEDLETQTLEDAETGAALLASQDVTFYGIDEAELVPGRRKCCSHPHGKALNITAASLAMPAIALSICHCIFIYDWAYPPDNRDRLWKTAEALDVVTPALGTIAMILGFTATCRAYRKRWLICIFFLYALCFSFQVIAIACEYASAVVSYYKFLGFSLPATILWLACAILAAFIPGYKSHALTSFNSELASRDATGDGIDESELVPGRRKCCSHPHGKALNITTASFATPAIGLSLTQYFMIYQWYGTPYYNPDRLWKTAEALGAATPAFGTIAMILGFTATCCAYRKRWLMCIFFLYALCFLFQLIALACEHASAVESHYYKFFGFSLPATILWLACAVLAALVPGYKQYAFTGAPWNEQIAPFLVHLESPTAEGLASRQEGRGSTANLSKDDDKKLAQDNISQNDEEMAPLTSVDEGTNRDAAEGDNIQGFTAFLPEDTFSLMALAPIQSGSFRIGLGAFILQLLTLSLLSVDIFETDSRRFLDLPPFTSTPVRISQIVAILIAVISQPDIIWSINIFWNGFIPYKSDVNSKQAPVRTCLLTDRHSSHSSIVLQESAEDASLHISSIAPSEQTLAGGRAFDSLPELDKDDILTIENEKQHKSFLAANPDKFIVLNIYAPWCDTWKRLEPKYLALKNSDEFASFPIVWSKMSVEHKKDYVKSLGVQTLPTTLIYAGPMGPVETFPWGPCKLRKFKKRLAFLLNVYAKRDTHSLAHPSTSESPLESTPTKCKWHAANCCRGVEGLFSLVVTFALVMRSETVRDLLLNFTAVEFISNVDNLIFLLAKWRYFGRKVRVMTKHPLISEKSFAFLGPDILFCETFPVPSNLFIFGFVFIIFFSAWMGLAFKQGSGGYLPPSFYVQLGDDEVPLLSFASGLYKREPIEGAFIFLKSGKVKYKADKSEDMIFHYCEQNEAVWVFASDEKCENWIIKSSEMPQKVFHLPSSEDMQWFVKKSKDSSHGEEMSFIRIREESSSFRSAINFECVLLAMDSDKTNEDGMCFHVGELQMLPVMGASYGRPQLLTYLNSLPVYFSYESYRYNSPNPFIFVLLSIGRRWALIFDHQPGNRTYDIPYYPSPNPWSKTEAIERALKADPKSFLSRTHEVNIEELLNETNPMARQDFFVITHISEEFDLRSPDSSSPVGLRFYRTSQDEQCLYGNITWPFEESKYESHTEFICSG